MELKQVEAIRAELQTAFDAIQQPRSDFALTHFVVGEKDTEIARYAQCVLELQMKHQNIKRGVLGIKKLELEIKKLRESGDDIEEIEAQEKEIDIEDTQFAMTGALREFSCLYQILQSFPRAYSYQEIQAAQMEYWQRRLIRESEHQFLSQGSIGVGHIEALRQAGIGMPVMKDGQRVYPILEAAPLEIKSLNGEEL